MLRLQLLGTPQIYLDDTRVHTFVTRKAQALFIYLAVSAQVCTRDTLGTLFWGNLTNVQARNNLRRILPNLRTLVGPHLLIDRETVVFDRSRPYWLDTEVFAQTLRTSPSGNSPPSIEQTNLALELYRGDFLNGFSVGDAPEFEAWALIWRENLRRLAIQGLDRLADVYLNRGQYAAGLNAANRLLALEPWYEAAHQKKMLLLAQSGQRSAALAAYEHCRMLLAEEFGAEPAPEIIALYNELRSGGQVFPSPEAATSQALIPDLQPAAVDWGDIPRAATFYGRQSELTQLKAWIVHERCALVAILGTGGVGKTALATQLVRGLELPVDPMLRIERVLWRSLLNAPPLETVIRQWLYELADNQPTNLPPTLDELLSLLFAYLRQHRCLLVLDNLESVLQAGEAAGQFQPEYAAYANLIVQMGEFEHRSSLLLTSRELPLGVARLERTYPVVRTLRLDGLPAPSGIALLRAVGLRAPDDALQALVQRYSGNPLALRLIAETVLDHYQGDAGDFLTHDTLIFEDIRSVLDQQFQRLTMLEQEIFFWLTIEREPISLLRLEQNFVYANAPAHPALLGAIRSLHRRSLVERMLPLIPDENQSEERFGLQNVILEYGTERLCNLIYMEFHGTPLNCLLRYGLVKAQATDYVRHAQIRLILDPVAQRLRKRDSLAAIATLFRRLLATLRRDHLTQAGYAGANLLHLALHLGIKLEGWDFSQLPIWGADLRKGHLLNTNFAQSQFLHVAFVEMFGAILATAFSADGEILAAAGVSSDIHLWRTRDYRLVGVCPGTARWVWAVAFSPNGRLLASGGSDCIVRLWEVAALHDASTQPETLLYNQPLIGHTDTVFALAFDPNGQLVASASADQTIRLWDVARMEVVQTFCGHTAPVNAVAFSPDGQMIASAGRDHTVRLWQAATGACLQIIEVPQSPVIALHFDPDGRWLVTAGGDSLVQVWQVRSGDQVNLPIVGCVSTFESDAAKTTALALSPNGESFATNGPDATIRIWARATGALLKTLHGHREKVQSIVFHPNGRTLVSGGWDQTVRVWDAATGYPLRTLQGYTNAVNGLALSPDGQILVSGNADGTIGLWHLTTQRLAQVQASHAGTVQAVAFHVRGGFLVSGGNDGIIRRWRIADAGLKEQQSLFGHSAAIQSLCFSLSGQWLASSSADQSVRLWTIETAQCVHVLRGHTRLIQTLVFSPESKFLLTGDDGGAVYRYAIEDPDQPAIAPQLFATVAGGCTSLAFSPDGALLAGAGLDHTIYLWRAVDGQPVMSFKSPVNSTVYALRFRPTAALDLPQLAMCCGTGAIYFWDIDLAGASAALRLVCSEHTGSVHAIEFTPDGLTLISGGADGAIRLWDVDSGRCRAVLPLEPPYLGMDITGATGLTLAQRGALTALGAIEHPDFAGPAAS